MKRCLSVIFSLFLCLFLHAQTHFTDQYTIVGDAEVVNGGVAWDAGATANDMREAGNIMQLSVKNVTLYKTGTGCSHSYYFAVALNHDLTTTVPVVLEEGTMDRTWGVEIKVDKSGVYDILYTYRGGAAKPTCTLTKLSEIDDLYTISTVAKESTMGKVTGEGRYECGTRVTLTASAYNGYRFTGWEDGISSGSRTITVTEDATYTALFAQGGFTLVGDADVTNNNADWDATSTANDMTFTETGEWVITIKGKTLYKTTNGCQTVYRFAVVEDHQLGKARPSLYSGTTFKRTLGRSLKIEQSGVYDLVFTYKESKSYPTVVATLVSALPDPTVHITVEASPANGGLVSVGDQPQASRADIDIECGTSTEITATAAEGYRFIGWDDGNTAIVRTVTLKENKTYTANFVPISNSFTLGGSLSGMGGGSGVFTSDGNGGWTLVIEGVTLIKTGTACSESYTFYVVRDNDATDRYPATGNGVSLTVNQTGVYNITITYKEGATKPTYSLELKETLPNPQITIEAVSDDETMGTVSGGGTGDCGGKIKISATPLPGYVFVQWLDKDGKKSTAASLTITLTTDNTYTAYFAPVLYTVIGDIDLVGGETAWDAANTEHDMQVNEDGVTWVYSKDNVRLDKTDDNGYCRYPYYCAVAKDHAIKPRTWPDVRSGNSYVRTRGQKVSVSQTGIYNVTYTFNSSSGTLAVSLKLIEDLDNPTFTLTATPNNPEWGEVTANKTPLSGDLATGAVYECNQSVKLTATNKPGNRFIKWDNGATAKTLTIPIRKDTSVIAIFEPTDYTLIGDADVITDGSNEWDPTDAKNQMTLSETGAWRIEVKNKTLVKTGTGCHATYRFAVALDHAFNLTWPKGIKSATNRTKGVEITVPQSGIYNIVYTYIDGQTEPSCFLDLVTPLDNPTYTITANPNQTDWGSVSAYPSPISGDISTGAVYECGTQVTLTAAVVGTVSKWVSWSTGSNEKSITISVTKDADYIATFDANVYGVWGDSALLYGKAWDIEEQRNDLITVYDILLGKNVRELWVRKRYLTTCDSPYSYQFNYNRGNKYYPSASNLQLSVTQNGLYDLRFVFESSSSYYCEKYLIEPYPDLFTISAKPNVAARGTVTGSGDYTCGEEVTLKATPNSGFVFKVWKDNSSEPGKATNGTPIDGATNSTLTVRADHSYDLVAVFDCPGGCPDIETLYLDHAATEVPDEYDGTHPLYLAYPKAVIADLPQMDCEQPVQADEEGVLTGLFSVSATDKVRFSQGNLQYRASTDVWRFAEHQWDWVGTTSVKYGNVYQDGEKSGNNMMAADYGGWIDLFNWGNSGWENSYPPYNFKKFYGEEIYKSITLVDEHANADWGVFNAISNGGNQPGLWRTLSYTEWNYLYSRRTNAKNLRGRATVNGVRGYIFLPDDWQLPEGLSFISTAGNNYSLSQWERMEKAGAVFLPAAGETEDEARSITNPGTYGYYWTATCNAAATARYYYFYNNTTTMSSSTGSKAYGRSVRLVKDVK
ncbi:MAG: hypothetical protein II952_05175 [Paludibacteraceae bacterium]|nr:hypothetical protein [Paludibacteraceae bacterium]